MHLRIQGKMMLLAASCEQTTRYYIHDNDIFVVSVGMLQHFTFISSHFSEMSAIDGH